MRVNLNKMGWKCPECEKPVKKTKYISSIGGRIEDGRYHPDCLKKTKKKEENYD